MKIEATSICTINLEEPPIATEKGDSGRSILDLEQTAKQE
jgi:hypothetical protein